MWLTLYLCKHPCFVRSSYPKYFSGEPFAALFKLNVSNVHSSAPYKKIRFMLKVEMKYCVAYCMNLCPCD